jgi:hypothetical protein
MLIGIDKRKTLSADFFGGGRRILRENPRGSDPMSQNPASQPRCNRNRGISVHSAVSDLLFLMYAAFLET